MVRVVLRLAALACVCVAAQKPPSRDKAVIVTTEQELIDAVDNYAAHVRVTKHLDLRNHTGRTSDGSALLIVQKSLISLTVCLHTRQVLERV